MMKSKFSTNQKWTLASLGAGSALENMDGLFLSFALMPMIMQLGVSNAAGGLMSTVTNISKLLGAVIFGMLADTFGRVRVFTYTIFLVAFAAIMMYFTNDIYLVYILRFITGLGDGGEYAAGVTIVAENFSKSHKIGSLISWSAGSGQLISTVLAACLAAVVLPDFGWHSLFLFSLIPVAIAFVIRKNLKENPKVVQNQKLRKAEHHDRPPFSRLFKTPKVAWQTIAIMIMALVEEAGYYGLMSWMPSMMQKQLHISVAKSALWMILTVVGVFIGMLVFGKLIDKFGPRVAFSTFLIGAAIVVYVFTLANSSLTLRLATMVVGFFAGATYSGFGVIVSKLYPMDIRVTANSFIKNMGRAIGGFSPVVIGLMMDNYSLTTIMLCLSVLYMVSLAVMFTIPNLKKI